MGDNDISEIERTDRGQTNVDKREARRLYKEKKTPMGIFVLRCRASGESWVSASNHLDTARNGLWFQLRLGSHLNKRVQESWNTHGEPAFEYEILETLEEDIPPLLVKDTLAARQKHWAGELQARLL